MSHSVGIEKYAERTRSEPREISLQGARHVVDPGLGAGEEEDELPTQLIATAEPEIALDLRIVPVHDARETEVDRGRQRERGESEKGCRE